MRSNAWKVRFISIWAGQTVSLLGSKLVGFALTWWLTEETGSLTILTTSNLVLLLPGIVFGPLVGTLIDRWNRRRVMMLADGAIALCTLVLAYLYWQDIVAIWHIYVILFLRSLGGTFHEPAMIASTSLMVPKEHLARVGGWDGTREGINRILGAPLGALLLGVSSIESILAIDVVTAILAIVPLLFFNVPQPAPSPATSPTRQSSRHQILDEMLDGFRYLWGWKGLFIMLVSMSLMGFMIIPTNSFTPVVIREHFGGGPEAFALHSAVVGIGMIAGGLLMSTWGGFERHIGTMAIGMLSYGFFGIVRGAAPANALWLWMVATFLKNFFNTMIFVPFNAMLQSSVPPEVQGRVFAARESLFMAMSPLGLAILGPVGDLIGPRPLIVLTGMAVLVMLISFALMPSVRDLENGPPTQARPAKLAEQPIVDTAPV